MITSPNVAIGTWPPPWIASNTTVIPALRISAAVCAAAGYGTTVSAVPSNISVGESAASNNDFANVPGSAPEMQIAAATLDEYPGFPLVPGSVELTATVRAVAAPADPPPTA